MKWSEQMRELQSADQVYHECVVDFNDFCVKLNGKNISHYEGKTSSIDVFRVPSKFENLFLDPFFIKNILFYADEYKSVYLFSIVNDNKIVFITFNEGRKCFITISDTPLILPPD